MNSKIEEVYLDFQNAESKIDFSSYNPNSDDFMTALKLGAMLLIMKECGSNDMPEEIKIIKENENADDISEEFQGAKKYMQMYIDSKDETFKNMAADELNHAMTLIKKASSRLPSGEERNKLKNYEELYKELNDQLNKL